MQKRVKSSNKIFKPIEVNVDTVYVRWDEQKWFNEDGELAGFEYYELQYEIKKFMESLASEESLGMVAMMVSILMGEIDTLNSRLTLLEGGN